MSERVLITGASGFLGYHIICSAIERGLVVYAAVRRSSNIEHLKELPVQYLFPDYEDKKDLARQLTENKIDYIIHAAGDTKAVTQEVYNHVNATYTLNIAKAAENCGNSFKKMVFISSLAAVGPLPDTYSTITEDTPLNPVTAYGRSKVLAEEYLANIAISTTILRPTAIYGPRDKNIFIMIKIISKGFDLFIGTVKQQLSFVHVKDVADLAIQSLSISNGTRIYNVTDGKIYSRYQLSDIIKGLLKKRTIRFHIPFKLVKLLAFFLETINGWLKRPSVINREKLNELAAANWGCDIKRVKNELGFAPKFDLQTGLEDTISWYQKHKWL